MFISGVHVSLWFYPLFSNFNFFFFLISHVTFWQCARECPNVIKENNYDNKIRNWEKGVAFLKQVFCCPVYTTCCRVRCLLLLLLWGFIVSPLFVFFHFLLWPQRYKSCLYSCCKAERHWGHAHASHCNSVLVEVCQLLVKVENHPAPHAHSVGLQLHHSLQPWSAQCFETSVFQPLLRSTSVHWDNVRCAMMRGSPIHHMYFKKISAFCVCVLRPCWHLEV